jgi:hypothetical protein
MYEPPLEARPGCRDVWVLTRATFGVLMWPLLALFGVLGGVGASFYLLTIHPALALVPIVALVGGVLLLARWESRKPPEL